MLPQPICRAYWLAAMQAIMWRRMRKDNPSAVIAFRVLGGPGIPVAHRCPSAALSLVGPMDEVDRNYGSRCRLGSSALVRRSRLKQVCEQVARLTGMRRIAPPSKRMMPTDSAAGSSCGPPMRSAPVRFRSSFGIVAQDSIPIGAPFLTEASGKHGTSRQSIAV